LERDVATESHRQCRAALKHAGEIESRCGDWARMLCNDTEYVEAIFVAEIQVSSVSEFRVASCDLQTLWDLCFRAHGESVTDAEGALAHTYSVLKHAEQENRIRLCEIPDV